MVKKTALSSLVGSLAFMSALVLAFAFTPKKEAPAKFDNSTAPLVWVKFDCNNPNQPETFINGNYRPESSPESLPNFEDDCGGEGNVCAVLLDYGTQTTVADAQGNVSPTIPISSIPENRIIRCQ